MFSVLYNLYIQGLGYNDTMNGQIVSIQSLATAIMFVPIGLGGDRFSRKRLLIAGALFSGIFLIGRSFDYSASGLIWFAVFSGLFAGVFQVLAIPFLAENVKKSQRLKMFSYYSSLVLASQVLGSLGGGVFADLLHTLGIAKVTGLQTVLFIGEQQLWPHLFRCCLYPMIKLPHKLSLLVRFLRWLPLRIKICLLPNSLGNYRTKE